MKSAVFIHLHCCNITRVDCVSTILHYTVRRWPPKSSGVTASFTVILPSRLQYNKVTALPFSAATLELLRKSLLQYLMFSNWQDIYSNLMSVRTRSYFTVMELQTKIYIFIPVQVFVTKIINFKIFAFFYLDHVMFIFKELK